MIKKWQISTHIFRLMTYPINDQKIGIYPPISSNIFRSFDHPINNQKINITCPTSLSIANGKFLTLPTGFVGGNIASGSYIAQYKNVKVTLSSVGGVMPPSTISCYYDRDVSVSQNVPAGLDCQLKALPDNGSYRVESLNSPSCLNKNVTKILKIPKIHSFVHSIKCDQKN